MRYLKVLFKLSKKKTLMNEGCLSVVKSYGAVKRSTRTTLQAYDEKGKKYERGAAGLLAQIFQHEVDHLDGLTINGDNWWFNLRASNTEPLLRLNVEASTEARMKKVRDDVLNTIRGDLDGLDFVVIIS